MVPRSQNVPAEFRAGGSGGVPSEGAGGVAALARAPPRPGGERAVPGTWRRPVLLLFCCFVVVLLFSNLFLFFCSFINQELTHICVASRSKSNNVFLINRFGNRA